MSVLDDLLDWRNELVRRKDYDDARLVRAAIGEIERLQKCIKAERDGRAARLILDDAEALENQLAGLRAVHNAAADWALEKRHSKGICRCKCCERLRVMIKASD